MMGTVCKWLRKQHQGESKRLTLFYCLRYLRYPCYLASRKQNIKSGTGCPLSSGQQYQLYQRHFGIYRGELRAEA